MIIRVIKIFFHVSAFMLRKICNFAFYLENNFIYIIWQNLLSKNRYAAIRWPS